MTDLSLIAQLITAIVIYAVWLIRPKMNTPFRCAEATSLKEEFAAYGLPSWSLYVIGVFKLSIATALVVGVWVPSLVAPAAMALAALMAGAVLMHLKMRGDSLMKALPASLMLGLCLFVITQN